MARCSSASMNERTPWYIKPIRYAFTYRLSKVVNDLASKPAVEYTFEARRQHALSIDCPFSIALSLSISLTIALSLFRNVPQSHNCFRSLSISHNPSLTHTTALSPSQSLRCLTPTWPIYLPLPSYHQISFFALLLSMSPNSRASRYVFTPRSKPQLKSAVDSCLKSSRDSACYDLLPLSPLTHNCPLSPCL